MSRSTQGEDRSVTKITVPPGELERMLTSRLDAYQPRPGKRTGRHGRARVRFLGAVSMLAVVAALVSGALGANVGGFEIDANQAIAGDTTTQDHAYYSNNDPSGAGDDWVDDDGAGGTTGVFLQGTSGAPDFLDCYDDDISIDPNVEGVATLICDGTSDSVFSAIQAENNIVSPSGQTPHDEWPISTGNNTPKNDISHGYILFRVGDSECDADTDNDDLFAYIGAERLNHEGSAFWGVELNKIAPTGFDNLLNDTPLTFTLDHPDRGRRHRDDHAVLCVRHSCGRCGRQLRPRGLQLRPAERWQPRQRPNPTNAGLDERRRRCSRPTVEGARLRPVRDSAAFQQVPSRES